MLMKMYIEGAQQILWGGARGVLPGARCPVPNALHNSIEGPLGRATPPPFYFSFGTLLQIGQKKQAM